MSEEIAEWERELIERQAAVNEIRQTHPAVADYLEQLERRVHSLELEETWQEERDRERIERQ